MSAELAAGRVATPPPGATVVAPSISPQRQRVAGYPAHPAGRAPVRGDLCVCMLDERGRLFIVSWEAP